MATPGTTSNFQIIGQFIDQISPGLSDLANKSIPALVGALGGLAVAWGIDAVRDMVLAAAEVGDELGKLSQRTGIAVEELSGLQTAARLSDVSSGELATSIRKLNAQLREAGEDSGSDAAEMFKKLGIEVRDSNGKIKEGSSALGEIADKFKETADDGNKVDAAFKLMGKSGVQMITVLNGGNESLAEMAKLTKDLGLDWSTEQTKQAEKLNDGLEILKMAFEGVGSIVAKELLPKLVLMIEALVESTKEGGLLRAMLDGLAALISGPVGAALDFLASVASSVAFAFHAAGIAIGGAAAAANALLNLDWQQAANIVEMMGGDLKKLGNDYLDFNKKIWNPEAAKKGAEESKRSIGSIGTKAKETGKDIEDAFEKAYHSLQKELATLNQSGKTSEILYQTQSGQYKDFSNAQKEKLIGLAREIDYHKLLLDMMKQEQSLTASRNLRVSNAEITSNANLVEDPKQRAGFIAAAQQASQMQIYLNNQEEIANKNLDKTVRDRLLNEIEEKRKLYQQNGLMYEQARKMGELEYDLTQKSKLYADAVGNLQTKVKELSNAQEYYNELLESGAIDQERYNDLIKQSSREIEDLKNNTTEAGRAFGDIVKSRRGMEDITERMKGLTEQQAAGTISAAEYKLAMYELQQSYDQINPVHATNQMQLIQNAVANTTAQFEGMFADTIFDAIQGRFDNLGDTVKNVMDRMVANILAAQLQFALFGDLGSTPAGKTPGSTGLIGSIFSGIFGGFRESGGPVEANRAYVVGEKRPELFVPKTAGTIVPDVGSKASNSTVNISISALDGADVMKILSSRKKEIANMVSTTNRTYNLRSV